MPTWTPNVRIALSTAPPSQGTPSSSKSRPSKSSGVDSTSPNLRKSILVREGARDGQCALGVFSVHCAHNAGSPASSDIESVSAWHAAHAPLSLDNKSRRCGNTPRRWESRMLRRWLRMWLVQRSRTATAGRADAVASHASAPLYNHRRAQLVTTHGGPCSEIAALRQTRPDQFFGLERSEATHVDWETTGSQYAHPSKAVGRSDVVQRRA